MRWKAFETDSPLSAAFDACRVLDYAVCRLAPRCQTHRCVATLQEVDTSAYDAWLEQLSEDTKQYVRAVFKTLVATVPKAIIHAQVLLPRLAFCPLAPVFVH